MTARQRGRVVLVLVIAVVLGLLLVTSQLASRRSGSPTALDATNRAASDGSDRGSGRVAGGADAGSVLGERSKPPERTVHDRAVRDAVRERIALGWAAAPPAPHVGPSVLPKHPGTLDRHYIQERIRADFAPMAEDCYEEMLSRRPGEQVRVTMQFRIVADPRYGGIVEEARAVDPADGGARLDAELARCMSESMLAMAFRPPAGEGGAVTVHYPFVMSPGDGG